MVIAAVSASQVTTGGATPRVQAPAGQFQDALRQALELKATAGSVEARSVQTGAKSRVPWHGVGLAAMAAALETLPAPAIQLSGSATSTGEHAAAHGAATLQQLGVNSAAVTARSIESVLAQAMGLQVPAHVTAAPAATGATRATAAAAQPTGLSSAPAPAATASTQLSAGRVEAGVSALQRPVASASPSTADPATAAAQAVLATGMPQVSAARWEAEVQVSAATTRPALVSKIAGTRSMPKTPGMRAEASVTPAAGGPGTGRVSRHPAAAAAAASQPGTGSGTGSLRHMAGGQAGVAAKDGELARYVTTASQVATTVAAGATGAARDAVPVQPADVAAQVAAAAQRAAAGMQAGTASVRLLLDPPQLGHVQVTLRAVQDGIAAVLRAENPAAIVVLQGGQEDLRQRFGELGFKASTVSVTAAERPRVIASAGRSTGGRRTG